MELQEKWQSAAATTIWLEVCEETSIIHKDCDCGKKKKKRQSYLRENIWLSEMLQNMENIG